MSEPISTVEKVMLGAAVLCLGVAAYEYYKLSKNPALAAPAATALNSAQSAPGNGGVGGGRSSIALANPALAAPVAQGFVVPLSPVHLHMQAVTLGLQAVTSPAPAPAPMPTNTVMGPRGPVSWGVGASYDAKTGIVTNWSGGPVALTSPDGSLKLSPNMSYNVQTGEFKF